MAKTDEIYQNAVSLAKAFDANFMELAENLRVLQDSDPDRYRDFVKATGMGLRKAYYLISVDKTFRPLKIPKSKLVELGWTKLMTIQPHVTKQNVHQLIEYAKTHTVAEIKSYLKGGSAEDNSHQVTMYFNPQDYGRLMDALIENGAKKSGRGFVDKEKALMQLIDTLQKK